MTGNSFNVRPVSRLFLFLLVSFICLLAGAAIVSIITMKGSTTVTLRLATVAQDIFMFILPAIVTAVMVTRRPATLLRIDSRYPWLTALLAVAGLLVAMPAMNALVAWNESLSLPASLAGVETWMRNSETAAQVAINTLLGGTGIGDLITGVLIVGILAGFSEEIFFRGTLQRLLATSRNNDIDRTPPLTAHVAIWGTAILFSAFHVQFFGFFPRLLLGAYFGYLLWWSRSLWVPVTVHAVNNSIVVIASWAQRAGYIEEDMNKAGADNLAAIIVSIVLIIIIIDRLRKRAFHNKC